MFHLPSHLRLLTGLSISTLADAVAACDSLHALGPRFVVVTSFHSEQFAASLCLADGTPAVSSSALSSSAAAAASSGSKVDAACTKAHEELFLLASESGGDLQSPRRHLFAVRKLDGYYSGTGDLTSALLLAFMARHEDSLPLALQYTCVVLGHWLALSHFTFLFPYSS